MSEHVLIKDMRPGMRNIACTFIVLEKGWFIVTRAGRSLVVESLYRVYFLISFRYRCVFRERWQQDKVV